ncbi:MAG: AtpZ/AtpI family protein [Candidatus Saccharimonadales bacterium]
MTKTLATPKRSVQPQHVTDEQANPSGIMVGLTMSMAWQLALTVLIPVVGGHLLDARLHPDATPIFTLIGLLLAIIGMIVVIRRTLASLNEYMAQHFKQTADDVKAKK